MSQINHPNVCDKGLEWVRDNTERIIACTEQPTDYLDALDKMVGFVETGPSDFTIADGDTPGETPRKITNQTLVGSVVREGETVANYTVWVSDSDEIIIIGNDATPQTLVFQNPLTFLPRKREIMAQLPE
jgi:hypothetical protein